MVLKSPERSALSSPGFVRTMLILFVIIALELLCRTKVIPPTTLSSPSDMAITLYRVLLSGDYADQIWATIRNVGLAALISSIVGFIAGTIIHSSPRIRRALQPFISGFYAVPGFIFYVPLLGVFGLNDAPLVAVGIILGLPSMILATLNGLDRIPQVLLKLARTYNLNFVSRVWLLQLPATTPYLFSGVRLSVAYAFIGVIASEFVLSDRGIGYSIAFAYHEFDTKTMYALMLLITILVTGVNTGLQYWETRWMRRRRRS
jgi:NitT/TauT family transport system permease protein